MSTLRPPLHWQQRYAAKLMSPAEAIGEIQPGRRLLIGSGAAEPVTLVQNLVEHGKHLADNEIVHLLTLGPAPYVAPEHAARFRHTAFFVGPNTREAVRDGRADFMPVFLSEIPELIRSHRVRIDVVLVQVSPPDHHGLVSLGVSVDIVRAAVDCAACVIAEVNPRMPRTLGDSFLPVDRIRALVEVDTPLLELHPAEPDEVATQIGQHVASLIPNGATLQTGIGTIPHAVMRALKNHLDLGVHTEMLSDSVIDLVEGGVITCAKKTLLPGKLVTSFIMGSQRLYAWVDDNPRVEMRPSNFTNNPSTIARNDRMICINSALAVDLTGQVAADGVRGQFFSGIGGQVDFIRGAAQSRGGKPIIALPSTAEHGKTSRIQAVFEPGTGVVTSRGDVHYVVTEYGIADLWGKNVRERALALTAIAHPSFRSELLDAAKKRHYLFVDQSVPRGIHPADEAVTIDLGSQKVVVRPVRITDERPLQDLLYRLSSESIYQRFLHYKTRHPHEEMLRLVDPDVEGAHALVAAPLDDDTGALIAMARYDLDPATQTADVAFVVDDAWQRKGLGTALLARLAKAAKERGVLAFTADALSSNKAMLGVFQASGFRYESVRDGSVTHVVLRF
jgi:acyl-CoA hydrolase/RimJ/RimL family protein N-acetyltransferase